MTMSMARALRPASMPKTGYVYHELYMWHNAGHVQSMSEFIQPTTHWEHPETKRRFHNLLSVSGVLDELHHLRPKSATMEQLTRCGVLRACMNDRSFAWQTYQSAMPTSHLLSR
jgi:hypothetical protein